MRNEDCGDVETCGAGLVGLTHWNWIGIEADMERLRLRLLGPFQATLDGIPLTHFRSGAARVLLAYLAVQPGRDFRREALADTLWPEHERESALLNLRQILLVLRRLLGEPNSPPFLLITPQTVQFNPQASVWLRPCLPSTAPPHTSITGSSPSTHSPYSTPWPP
jgi:hypothetical protein